MKVLLLAAAAARAAGLHVAVIARAVSPLRAREEKWSGLEEWTDAIAAFEDEDEVWEEESFGPRSDAPAWVAAAVAARGDDAEAALAVLSERERQVVHARYWAAEPSTQLDVSNDLGMSLARVNQLEKAARRKLDAAPEEGGGAAAAASREAAAGALLLGRFRREVGYFYFRDGLGLGEDALDRLLAQHGPVLSQTRATLEAKGDALRAALNLTGGDLARIVSAQPTLLGHGAAPMAKKIEWLASATGCSAADLGRACVKCPALLSASARRVLGPNVALFDGLEAGLASTVLRRSPGALRTRDLEATLGAVRRACGGGDAATAACVRRAPNALAAGAAAVDGRVAFFAAAVGAERDVADLIARRPALLEASEERLGAVADALRAALGLTRREASALSVRVAIGAPKVVASVARAKVEERCAFLTEDLGLDRAAAAAVVRRRPALLGLRVDGNLRATAAWLEGTLGVDAGAFVARYPTILGLSIATNLAPKLALLEARGGSRDAARAAIARCPALLGYAREARLRPRLDAIEAAGLPFGAIAALAPLPEAAFDLRLAKSDEARRPAGVVVGPPD